MDEEEDYRCWSMILLHLGNILTVLLACCKRERVSRIGRKGKRGKERRLREGSRRCQGGILHLQCIPFLGASSPPPSLPPFY
jgi:hypothetical protein